MKFLTQVLALSLVLVSLDASAAKLQVGSGRAFGTLSSALGSARDRDVIQVDAGIYQDQAVTVRQNDLTIRGVGGLAHFKWVNGMIDNGKGIILIQGSRVTIENLELSGARVVDANGAGIRVEPKSNVTIRNCYIHDNENGLLTSNDGVSSVVIENSEFNHNGAGDGYTHNMYIGSIASFTLRFSYSHRAHIGHNVKSRAKKNFILYNRVMDEADGDASYLIDIPDGGETYIIGNLLQKSPLAQNPTLISYGEESLGKVGWTTEVYIVNNTMVNNYKSNTNFIFIRAGTYTAKIMNNIFSGPGTMVASLGAGSFWNLATNLEVVGDPGFRLLANYDYSLTSSATEAINKGTTPGMANGVSLDPTYQYIHPLKGIPRPINGSTIDIGAYEYGGDTTAPVVPTNLHRIK